MEYVIDRAVCEGGRNIVKLTGYGGIDEPPNNHVFDKMLVVATARTARNMFVIHNGGTTLRNVLAVVPNAPPYYSTNIDTVMNTVPNDTQTQANADAKLAIYNCTALNLRSAANDTEGDNWRLIDGDAEWNDLDKENNVVHAPNINSPVTVVGIDISTAIAGFAPRFATIRYNSGHVGGAETITGTFDSPATLPVPRPVPTSPAYRTATSGRVAYDDFFGTVRGATPSRGAVEPG